MQLLKSFVYLYQTKKQKHNIMIDLNTITKEQLAEELICNDELTGFYMSREKEILDMSFDLEEMVDDLEEWLIKNCDA